MRLEINKLKNEREEVEHFLEVHIRKLVVINNRLQKLKYIFDKFRKGYALTAGEQKTWDGVQNLWKQKVVLYTHGTKAKKAAPKIKSVKKMPMRRKDMMTIKN